MEKVQLNLERFLPELRDLERKNIFSKSEIEGIVAQRRAHEVATSKRDVKPTDYLRYIEYETKVEKLRKARAARIQITTRKTLSDHSIAAHITQLHRLSVRRFPSSLLLWDAFLSHALSQSSPALVSRTLSAAIAMHPTHVPYWIMASRWESDGDRKGMGGGNEEAARRLCMRALRFLKGSTNGEEEIWKEWIRVEVVFAERMRARWTLLGIGKIHKENEESMEVDKDDEEGDAEAIEIPDMPEGLDGGQVDQTTIKVESASAASGQEALRDGVIVRVVMDSCLTSFSHSIPSYERLLSILRPLPSILRLPLLSHVYVSLAEHHPISSPFYPQATKIVATRHLYDIAYDAKDAKTIEDADSVKVEGEALVDAVGYVTEEFWKACRGSLKGKGKQKEKAPVGVWIVFCQWLDQTERAAGDESLGLFLSTNLTSALSLAPSSSVLALLNLQHLIRTSATPAMILATALTLTQKFGSPPVENEIREQVWTARTETTLLLSSALTAEEVTRTLVLATKAVPFSGRIWSLFADWAEQTKSPTELSTWFIVNIQRCLLSDAVPSIGFVSKIDNDTLAPRELLPRRYISYLLTSGIYTSHLLETLLKSAPTITLHFLSYLLETIPSSGADGARTRAAVHDRIVADGGASSKDWLAYAEELLGGGELIKANEVVGRARRTLQGSALKSFETEWRRVCDA